MIYTPFLVSVDTANDAKLSFSTSDNLPVIVGGIVGTCVVVIIGAVLALFFIRYVCFHKFVLTVIYIQRVYFHTL